MEILNNPTVRFLLKTVAYLAGIVLAVMLTITLITTAFASPSALSYFALATLSTAIFAVTHKKDKTLTKARFGYGITVTAVWSLGMIAQALPGENTLVFLMIPASVLFGTTFLVGRLMKVFEKWFQSRVRKILDIDSDDKFGLAMAEKNFRMFQNNPDPMLRGDTLQAALMRWPLENFPTLYQRIRPDIRNPIMIDDRLPGGEHLNELAPLRVNEETVISAYNVHYRTRATFYFGMFISIALMLSIWGGASFSKLSSGDILGATKTTASNQKNIQKDMFGDFQAQESNLSSYQDPNAFRDYFSQEDGALAVSSAPKTSTWFAKSSSWIVKYTSGLLMVISMFSILACLAYFFVLRSLLNPSKINGVINKIVNLDAPLLTLTPRSVVTYEHNIANRKLHIDAYAEVVVETNRDKSAFIPVFVGTDNFLVKGFHNSWSEGQIVGNSLMGFKQHTIVFGFTGSGKSYSVLTPFLYQQMTHVSAVKNRDYKFNVLIFDAGCTLQSIAMELAKSIGWKVRSIGMGLQDLGIDCHMDLNSNQLQEMYSQIESICGSGTGQDTSWKEGSDEATAYCAEIMIAAEAAGNFGINRAAQSGERYNSPIQLGKLRRSMRQTTGELYDACSAIIDAAESKDEAVLSGIAPFLTPTLWSAIEFARSGCFKIPEKQFMSQMATANKVYGIFEKNPFFRQRFGAAVTGCVFDLESMFQDDKTLTAIMFNDSIDGSLAAIGNVLVMTRIIAMRTKMSIQDPSIGDRSLVATFCDEIQGMISNTSSDQSFSLTSFLARARKTGMFFFGGTQTVAGVYKAMGETSGGQASKAFLGNFVNLACLASSDEETISFVNDGADNTTRYHIAKDGYYESYFSHRLARGESPTADITPYKISYENMVSLFNSADSSQYISAEMKPLVEVDEQFYAANYGKATGGFVGGMGGQQQQSPLVDWTEKAKSLIHRAEDRAYSLMNDGRSSEPLISKTEFLAMGRNALLVSFVIAGKKRIGICKPLPELGAAPGVIKHHAYSVDALPPALSSMVKKNEALGHMTKKAKLIQSMRAPIAIDSEQKDLIES
ncbi:MAG: hypothetical protein Q7K26_06085 [bacterium]|nr:hypothetical protein [bacterium]